MVDFTPILTAATGAVAGIIGAFAVIHRTRTDAKVAQDTTLRGERIDAITVLTTQVAQLQIEVRAERERGDEWQAKFYSLLPHTLEAVNIAQTLVNVDGQQVPE